MLRCREIRADDLKAITDLLARGPLNNRRFRDYSSRVGFWQSLVKWLETVPKPIGLPKYGYCLEMDGRIVGVLLLSFSIVDSQLRCNVSSWYVEPQFRVYASILASYATRHKAAIFFNLTPAPHTWSILEAQGYVKYAGGRFITFPALCRSLRSARVWPFTEDTQAGSDLSQSEINVLRDHTRWGCISLVCEHDRQRYPFVFKTRRAGGIFPICRLIYCRDIESFGYFAGTIGGYLLHHGCCLIITDAEGPLPRMPGIYLKGARRYWKGPKPMRLGDMAYSEIVMLDW